MTQAPHTMLLQRLIPVTETSQIGEARRIAARLAETTSLNTTDRGRVAIVVTELATNLVRHAGGGHVLVRATDEASIELLAVDRGKGMDLARCMQDGFSTGGTAGNGMGAIRRQSNAFDIYTDASGSVIRCQIGHVEPVALPMTFGVAQSNAPGETVCGDGWRMAQADGRAALMVVDGLGHGAAAADAAYAAQRVFDDDPFADPEVFLPRAHRALSGTRGAAVAIALVEPEKNRLRYAGVGNIAGTLLTGTESRGLMSHNGTVGHQVRKIQAIEYAWTQRTTLVMHSDGLQTRWTTAPYPGLLTRHPSLLAAVLLRDFTRGRDDATAAVLRAAAS